MRGIDEMQGPLFTTVKLEDIEPADHPLRPIRLVVNQARKRFNGLLSTICTDCGRASIAPEKLLRALLLQVLYPVHSERMLMEQMRYTLLMEQDDERGTSRSPLGSTPTGTLGSRASGAIRTRSSRRWHTKSLYAEPRSS